MHDFRLQILTAVMLCGLFVAPLPAQARTVALPDFTTDDNHYPSLVAAANFTTALQAELSGTPRVQWVERQQLRAAEHELEHSVRGRFATSSRLRVGRWLQADLILLGQFAGRPDGGVMLRIELVDATRADLLVERQLTFAGGVTNCGPAEISATARLVREALAATQHHLDKRTAQITIAPLFFRNTGREDRLDFFEADLLQAVRDRAAREQLHVLHFPKASAAAGEAELVMRGLADAVPDGWRRVADVYLWGDVSENESSAGMPFNEIPVTARFHVWDGRHEPVSIIETGRVDTLPALAQRAAQHILEHAVKRQPDATPETDAPNGFGRRVLDDSPSDSIRQRLAQSLFERAVELRSRADREKHDYYATPEGQRCWSYVARLLEVAGFFAPENQAIWRERLLHRWTTGYEARHPDYYRHHFWRYWQESEEWGEYAARFDVRHGEAHPIAASRYLYSQQHATRFLRERQTQAGFPSGVTDAVNAEWVRQFETEYVRRAIAVADRIAEHPAQLLWFSLKWFVHEPREQVALCESLWPLYLREGPKRGFFVFQQAAELAAMVRQAYVATGHPERAEQLLTTAPVPPTEIEQIGPPREALLAVPRLDVRPPSLEVTFQPLTFPAGTEAEMVTALTVWRDRVWVSLVEGTGHGPQHFASQADKLTDYRDTQSGRNSLWNCGLSGGGLTNISSTLGAHSKVTRFLPRADGLWLALQGDGIWRVEPGGHTIRRYTARDGLLSANMLALAAGEATLYCGGGSPTDGTLNRYHLRTSQWQSLPIKNWSPPGGWPAVPPRISHLLNNGPWLLVSAGEPMLFNALSEHWERLSESFFGESLRRRWHDQRLTSADIVDGVVADGVFWLATQSGLIRFDPVSRAIRRWFPPYGGHQQNLHSGVWIGSARVLSAQLTRDLKRPSRF